MAGALRPVFCQIRAEMRVMIVLQPRVCTLRSFGGTQRGLIRLQQQGNTTNTNTHHQQVSQFFEILTDYVESSKKSHDFEIISGRLAMIVFAATVGMEIMTGSSIFRKMDLQGIEEGAGVCMSAITSAATFAWFTSNRNRVGRIFTIGCNTFIDALIDQIVDRLFYDTNFSDWSE